VTGHTGVFIRYNEEPILAWNG